MQIDSQKSKSDFDLFRRFERDRINKYRQYIKAQARTIIAPFIGSVPKFDNLDDANEMIAKLWKAGVDTLKKIDELSDKVNTNSGNSSCPPSQDSIADKAKRHNNRKSKSSTRKQGAPVGHKGSYRKLLPVEAVNEIVTCDAPEHCPSCDSRMKASADHARKQVTYLLDKRLWVKEFQIHKSHCNKCHLTVKGKLPEGTPIGSFAPCVHAAVSALTGRYKMSKRDASQCLYDLLGLSISTGSVSNLEHIVSKSLKTPTDEIHEALKESQVTNNDETGFYRKHQNTWLWVSANESLAYFKIQDRRNRESAKFLLGSSITGIKITDRCPSYSFIPKKQHQYCWAHLIRDIKAISERHDENHSSIGMRLESARQEVFNCYRRLHNQSITNQKEDKQNLIYHIKQFRYALRDGACFAKTKTGRFCRNIIRDWQCLWHFLRHKVIEPTNNHAERIIRHCVLWRKISHGTQSLRGDRYVERISTIHQTCRLQGVHMPTFIENAVKAWQLGNIPPSLVSSG